MAGVAFGAEMRREFMMSPDVTPINHGSWGACPKRVFEAKIKMLQDVENKVDDFFRFQQEPSWFENLRAACEFLNLDEKNTTLVTNTTAGINTIVKALPLKETDEILAYTYTYGAIRNAMESAAAKSHCKVVTMQMNFEISSKEEVIQNFTQTLDAHPNIRVAVIDYISSATATVFPVKQLCAACRARGVISVVDGAHAAGQLKLDMNDMCPDFFVSNLHKWMYTPRAVAVMWMRPEFQATVRPLVTSHCYNVEPFQKDYAVQGTVDKTSIGVIKDAVQFYRSIGGHDAVYSYITALLDEAVEYLVKLWGTEKFPIPRDMEAPYLRLVRLPPIPRFPIPEPNREDIIYGDYLALMHHMIKERKVICCLILVKARDGSHRPYARLSGQIYNTMDDYKRFGEEILKLTKEQV